MELECERRKDEGAKAKATPYPETHLDLWSQILSIDDPCCWVKLFACLSVLKAADSFFHLQEAGGRALNLCLPLHPLPPGLSLLLCRTEQWGWRIFPLPLSVAISGLVTPQEGRRERPLMGNMETPKETRVIAGVPLGGDTVLRGQSGAAWGGG